MNSRPKKCCQKIHDERVHPDDDKSISPPANPVNVNDPMPQRCGEHPPATTVKYVRRRPKSLYDWTNAPTHRIDTRQDGWVERDTRDKQQHAGDNQPAHFLWFAASKPASSHHAE